MPAVIELAVYVIIFVLLFSVSLCLVFHRRARMAEKKEDGVVEFKKEIPIVIQNPDNTIQVGRLQVAESEDDGGMVAAVKVGEDIC
jgi:hypothetical protein